MYKFDISPFTFRLFALGGAALLIAYLLIHRSGYPTFKTLPVERGNLRVSISATGTVEPEESIDVGAQVAGIILSFGKDITGKTIDYGSEVDAGTVLAQIDDSLYQTDLLHDKAALESAKANLQLANSKLSQAERNWKRVENLVKSNAISTTDYDSYKAAYEEGLANVSVADAAIKQADASLARSQRNVDYCVIRSPVKGVIIDRKVNIGQTVVSSLNAPSLFLIAKDLKRMEVWVSVNEADIGKIHEGQEVVFSVDALPADKFKGVVGKIRLNASMTQNVVTYIVEVSADNSEGRLVPYLTANARFLVSDLHDVLLVPNAALRWNPKNRDQSDLKDIRKDADFKETGTVWLDSPAGPQAVHVEVISSDGVNTGVKSDELKEGSQLIVAELQPNDVAHNTVQGTSNPFTPTMTRGGRH